MYRCFFFFQSWTLNVMEEWHAAKKRPTSLHIPTGKDYFSSRTPSRILCKNNFSIVIFAIQEMWPAVHGSQQAKAQWAGKDENGQCELCLCQTLTHRHTYNAKISRVLGSNSWAILVALLCWRYGVFMSFKHCTDPDALNSWMSSVEFHFMFAI